MKPYYSDDYVTIYHGDCREVVPLLAGFDVIVSDAPYGISYQSQSRREGKKLARNIKGDTDTSLRDWMCSLERPTLCFGTWKVPPPAGTKETLVWDKKGALGMGDLSIPWKRSWEEIYVLGKGFHGRRESAVLSFAPVQSTARNGRVHPHEKPVDLMRYLILRCPKGVILDPFMGSGPTMVAAKDLGRKAIGIEVEEFYCEIAASRASQSVLIF